MCTTVPTQRLSIESAPPVPMPERLAELVADRIAAEMPRLAAKMQRGVFVTVLAEGLRNAAHPVNTCPDGRTWCTGDPASHADPREHIHRGPEVSMNGAYGFDIMAVHLLQWDDDEVQLAFAGMGDWPDLNVDQVDELINDMATHLNRLRALRSQMAVLQDAADYADSEQHRRARDCRDDAGVRAYVTEGAGR